MKDPHPLLPNLNDETMSRMLAKLGIASPDELFGDIPEAVRLKRKLRIPGGKTEYEVKREFQERLGRNSTPPAALCFLGGGVWPHYVPAAVESVVSRQEFYTSYTPYQAEASQGMLQALFEYQSLMCDLTGMEVCNSSLYDWASAAAEAVRMAFHVNGRKKVLVAASSGRERLEVISAYAAPLGLEFEQVRFDRKTGKIDTSDLKSKISPEVAALYFENPNYFGVIEEDAADVSSLVGRAGALTIVGVDPISLSLVREPGAYGADVTVGEGQPLGSFMNYGGPHLGIFAVKDMQLARSMPGRLIGLTSEAADRSQKAFAMVLQTREQHIRREGATSNVCTNQSLMAVAAASYLALLGRTGFRRLGETVISNSHAAAEALSKVPGLVSPMFKGAYFKEFAVKYRKARAASVFARLARRGVLAGYPVSPGYGLEAQAGMYCVTEVHNGEDIDRLASEVRRAL
jgi:glycine cleavage system P protein (glycine dehydrogenase) subunit 1